MTRFYVTEPEMNMPFEGAKIALILGDQIVTILRDDRPDIPYPAHWDLPGGGREGAEAPVPCVLRETQEELGLQLKPEMIHWGRQFAFAGCLTWFFAARLPLEITQSIRFGDEGQRWALMNLPEFLSHPMSVPQLCDRLNIYLGETLERKNPPLI